MKKVTNTLRKNQNWSLEYNTPQNPYNKQVFIERDLRFTTAIKISGICRFSAGLIGNNLTPFGVFFQPLNIDLNQLAVTVLIVWFLGDNSKNLVNDMYK